MKLYSMPLARWMAPIPTGYLAMAATTFVDADTVDEYIETGAVKSVTDKDFPDPQ